ncbi:MAG: class I SAM-dependent methyltransferase [Solirubrobacterales bacterium]|nr:class I SAM-dependent methyltransferase [Solirubrobacterales bacterium]
MTGTHEQSLQAVVAKRAVIWHELECGAYRADMALWRELAHDARAEMPPGAALDIGAGSGRVSLDLARGGAKVTALDIDPVLLGALERRAGSTGIQTVCADARDFELERADYALCLAPMQTIQLLGGPDGRIAFLRRARAHLRPGGLLACAIVTELEPFDCTAGGPGPSPESVRIDGVLYMSRAVRVALTRGLVRIERERSVLPAEQREPPGAPSRERNVIELDHLSAARLHREGSAAGLQPAGTRTIAATEEHVGSLVVMFRA